MIQNHDDITGVSFVTRSTKHDIAVVTLSTNDNLEFLENVKQGFKRKCSWNKYRSEITTQLTKKIDYLIHSTFKSINKLFVL